ncbi:MAG: amidohydrolase family protein [Alphaproteobacteria bacterium]
MSKIISADSHVQEAPEIYKERLPKKFHDRVPHIEIRDGKRYRIVDGRKPRRLDVAETRETEEDREREFRSDPTGGRDIAKRLKDLDRDGIDAEVIYPNDSLSVYQSPDPEYQLAVARAYNDWIVEWFGGHRDRFAPVGVVPVSNIPEAVKEVQRVAKLGLRAVKVPIVANARPYNRPEYEPLWAALADAGIVLTFHSFTNDNDQYPEDWGEEEGFGGALSFMALSMAEGLQPVSYMISSGALERHPKLKMAVVESGAGWLAWLLYVLDEQVEKKHMWIRPRLKMKPSEYFKRQGYVTFSDDPMALKNIEFTGADCLMWGSDYPHDEGTFPNSRAVIERTFKGLSDSDRRKIVHDNAAKLYGFA